MDFKEIKKKKEKKSKLINNGLQVEITVIISGKNVFICHFFIYWAILAIFFLFSLFWWDKDAQSVKIAFRDKNGLTASIRILGVVGGVTPLRADHLFLA